ncbi:hypothetical protein V8D89_015847 [Ganoderma adspersum]
MTIYSCYIWAGRKQWYWARATGAARDHRDPVAAALSRDLWAELKPGKKRSGEPEAREADREDRPNGSDQRMKGRRWWRHQRRWHRTARRGERIAKGEGSSGPRSSGAERRGGERIANESGAAAESVYSGLQTTPLRTASRHVTPGSSGVIWSSSGSRTPPTLRRILLECAHAELSRDSVVPGRIAGATLDGIWGCACCTVRADDSARQKTVSCEAEHWRQGDNPTTSVRYDPPRGQSGSYAVSRAIPHNRILNVNPTRVLAGRATAWKYCEEDLLLTQ